MFTGPVQSKALAPRALDFDAADDDRGDAYDGVDVELLDPACCDRVFV